jgi:hypothetical protein
MLMNHDHFWQIINLCGRGKPSPHTTLRDAIFWMGEAWAWMQ